jgi:hypothetical protein
MNATALMRRVARRKADALFATAARSLDAVANFAASHGGSPEAAGAALADVANGWWADVLVATCHVFDQTASALFRRDGDGHGLVVVGPGLLALLGGWQEFADELGIDPDWSCRPGAEMVRRAADAAGPATEGDVVNFGHGTLTADQVRAGLRRRLESACSWWAANG